ncbi:MAG: phytoene/squalene synthase family protein [Verrucomicrobiota bacterium]
MSAASEITRKAKSNLAFALAILPRDRRDDMVVFYAFCRTMDDLADDTTLPADQRRHSLETWRSGLIDGFSAPDAFQREVISLRDRRAIPNDLLLAIIDGCTMDLQPQRFQTRDELSGYIWKVACAVGLVSIRLFGCREKASETYAVALGQALQLTNILRDVGEDLDNGGRIYLPLEDLARFDLTEADLAARVRDDRFLALMDDQATLAESYFEAAEKALPAADRRALLPARIMAETYRTLLRDMRADRFRVFEKRYRLSKPRKLAILAKQLIARSR